MILNSTLHFFSKPPDFLHIQGEIHYKLPIQQFPQKQHIFWKERQFLLLGINICRRILIQASVSSNKSFQFWFLKVLVYFSKWHSNAYFFFAIIIVTQVVLFVLITFIEMNNLRFYPKIYGNFPLKRNRIQCPWNEIILKGCFSVKIMRFFEKKMIHAVIERYFS